MKDSPAQGSILLRVPDNSATFFSLSRLIPQERLENHFVSHPDIYQKLTELPPDLHSSIPPTSHQHKPSLNKFTYSEIYQTPIMALVQGVKTMLTFGFLHGDIKGKLRKNHGGPTKTQLKIIDLEVAADVPVKGAPKFQVTKDFGAPEDQEVWSLGLVLLELLYAENPFRTKIWIADEPQGWRVEEMIEEKERDGVMLSESTREMLVGMLEVHPNKRLPWKR
ncbi:hypothetical protein BJ742DRAFT_770017 [Cladochytrium replicatum]|nr:hypothetical protein BJ742DRAFT_770017 [Cladochytrium replicatum]